MRIRLKFLLLLAAAGLGLYLAVWVIVGINITEVLTAEMSKRASALVQQAACDPVMKAALSRRSETLALRRFGPVLSALDVVYAEALAPDGTVIARTGAAEPGKVRSDPGWRAALASGGPVFKAAGAEGKRVALVYCRVPAAPCAAQGEALAPAGGAAGNEPAAGVLRVAVSLEETLRTIRVILVRVLAATVLIFAAAMAIIVFLTRKMVKQLELMLKATSHIGRSATCATVPVVVSDELGDLAGSFNEMSRNLEATMVSRDFLDNVLANMRDALLVTGADGRIEMVNRAMTELSGYSERELVGQPVSRFIRSGRHDPDSGLETELLVRSGEEIPVSAAVSRFNRAGDGAALEIMSCRDIREHRKMEFILRQSEKLSAVGQLAAGVAHEINNPMGVILGFAQAMRSRVTKGDPLDIPVTNILREAERCKTLVRNLLTFSRESGTGDMELLDLNKAVEEALSLVLAQGRMKEISVVKDLADGLPRIKANKNQVEQILVNLGTNAIDAMSGGGTLTVCTRSLASGPAGKVLLRVSDTGSGIPPEIAKRIFDPFFTTKEVGKGTGLGLSLVHEIVQKHGAAIDLASEPGKGAAFSIIFPAAEENSRG